MPSAGTQTPKKTYKKTYKKKAMTQSKPSPALKKAVRTIINKEVEDKLVVNKTVIQQANIPGAGLTSAGLGVLSPISVLLTQGTNEASRIGNKVITKKMYVRYSINALPTNEVGVGALNPFRGLPFLVRVVIYRHRYNMGDSSPDALIDDGSSSTFLNGDVDTYFRPYNKDEYQVIYSKTHKLQPIRHLSGSGYIDVNQDNKFSNFVIRNATIKCPKTLIFNDNNSQPTNFNYHIGFSVCNVDGSAITTAQTRATVNCESFLYFQDA